MTVSTVHCRNSRGAPKERFASEHAARKALGHKARFSHRRWPRVYFCPGCSGFHLTSGGAA